MRIQLLGSDDISPEDYEAVEKAWSSYMESYADMSVERTIGLGGCEVNPGFLKRYVSSIPMSDRGGRMLLLMTFNLLWLEM